MEIENESLIGKKIRLYKISTGAGSGFIKLGILRRVETNFVEIEYYDGRREIIPFSQIQSIVEDRVGT